MRPVLGQVTELVRAAPPLVEAVSKFLGPPMIAALAGLVTGSRRWRRHWAPTTTTAILTTVFGL